VCIGRILDVRYIFLIVVQAESDEESGEDFSKDLEAVPAGSSEEEEEEEKPKPKKKAPAKKPASEKKEKAEPKKKAAPKKKKVCSSSAVLMSCFADLFLLRMRTPKWQMAQLMTMLRRERARSARQVYYSNHGFKRS